MEETIIGVGGYANYYGNYILEVNCYGGWTLEPTTDPTTEPTEHPTHEPITELPTSLPSLSPTELDYVSVSMKINSLNNNDVTDSICNKGKLKLELDIDSGENVQYNQTCQCSVIINNAASISNDQILLSLLIDSDSATSSSLNNCYLNIDGNKLISGSIYQFIINKTINGIHYSANHTLQSIVSPTISSFDILTNATNTTIYSMDPLSAFGINITQTTFNINQHNTKCTIYSHSKILASPKAITKFKTKQIL